jgi:phospholipase/lecithinase/hemolysin
MVEGQPMKRSRLVRAVLVFSFTLWVASSTLPASAGQFTKLVVLGDSLSDTGNLFAATGGAIPPSPYYHGRFSNGPIWVEYLAAALDVPFEDLAYGGAKTDQGNLFDGLSGGDFPGLADEVVTLMTPRALDPDAVYVVWAGANDFREALSDALPRGETPDIAGIIGNVVNAVGALYLAGARHVVVPNLPDLGLTPEGRESGAAEVLTVLSQIYNANLEAALAAYTPAAVRMDVFRVMTRIVNDPDEYGFANVTAPCLTSAGVCATPDSYLFWDHVHPTTAGHALLAEKFAKAINQGFVKHHRNALR